MKIETANQNQTQHTPTPWSTASPQMFMGVACVWIHGATGPVLKIEGSKKEAVIADAAFIVRAVNSHVELVSFIKKLLAGAKGGTDYPGEAELIAQAEALIAKAEEK